MSYVSLSTRETFSKVGRELLGAIASIHEQIISVLLDRVRDTIEKVGMVSANIHHLKLEATQTVLRYSFVSMDRVKDLPMFWFVLFYFFYCVTLKIEAHNAGYCSILSTD